MTKKDTLPVLISRALKLNKGFIASSGSARLDALLDRSDAPALIQKAKSDDLHYLIKHIGINDSQEIMLYAKEKQIKDFLAIETFQGDRFVPERLQFYIEYVNDISHDKALRLIKELDPEGFALLIHKYADVKVIDEDNDPQDEEMPFLLSPDGVFMLVFRDEEATGQAEVKRILDLLYETDIALGRRVLFLCVYDLPSNVEETLFRFREEDMESMGFPNYGERFDIFSWVPALQMKELVTQAYMHKDRVNMHKSVAMEQLPDALVLYDAFSPSLFYDALMQIQDPRVLRMLFADFQYLVDAVMRALHKDLSVDGAWETAAKMANGFLSVGLDFITDNNTDMAAFVLEKFYTKDVFRAGFTLFDQVARDAKKLVSHMGGIGFVDLFDELTEQTLRALQSLPPRLYEGLVKPGSMGLREPITWAEVQQVRAVVDQAVVIVDYMKERFGFSPKDSAAKRDFGFDAVFNTAAVRSLLYGTPGIAPLDSKDIKGFIDLFLKDSEVLDGLLIFAAKDAESFYHDRPNQAKLLSKFTVGSIKALASDLKEIDTSKRVDPRFIGDRLLVVR